MDKAPKTNEQEDFSMSFDDNYNQQEFLKNLNNQGEKLTIMDGFNELCQKLHYINDQDKQLEKQGEHAFMQYYTQCKEKIGQQQQKKQMTETLKKNQNHNAIMLKLDKPSPIPIHQPIRSTLDNHPLTPTSSNRLQAYQLSHKRNPSSGENVNVKKTIQQVQVNDCKRNYSSVEENKKILQPSKNVAKQNQSLTMKDYFGEENNFVSKKVHGKNFISKETKMGKEQSSQCQQNPVSKRKQPMSTNMQTLKFGNENSLKDSNLNVTMKRTTQTQKNTKQPQSQRLQKPKITLYKKIIDLTQSTQLIIDAYKSQQVKSDYEIFSESQSTIDEGLFAKAIGHQRATKTVQSVQSPSSVQNYNNYLQPSYKDNGKQYIQSPINISYSPNPTNKYKSIFQKRENYR